MSDPPPPPGNDTFFPPQIKIVNCGELRDHLVPHSESFKIILLSAGWTVLAFIVLLLCVSVMVGLVKKLYPRAPEITEKITNFVAMVVLLFMMLCFLYQLAGLYPTIPIDCTITTAHLIPNRAESVYVALLNIAYVYRGEDQTAHITKIIHLSSAWSWSNPCPEVVPVGARTRCRYRPEDPSNVVFDENEIVLFTCLLVIYGCVIGLVAAYQCLCSSRMRETNTSDDGTKREFSFDDALPDVSIQTTEIGYVIPSSSQLESMMTLEKNQRIMDKFAMLIFELSKFNVWNPLQSPIQNINWGKDVTSHDGAFGTVISQPHNYSIVWKLYPKLDQTPSLDLLYHRSLTAINEICCNWITREHVNIISYEKIGICTHPMLKNSFCIYMTIKRVDSELKDRYRSAHAIQGWGNPSKMNMIEKISESDAVTRLGILKQLIDAVQHLHSKGVVHLDLHGGNIRLDEGDQVFISDFGNARYFPLESPNTRTNEVDFSPLNFKPGLYVSEGWGSSSLYSWQDKNINFDLGKRMDIFSLGIIVFQLFFGYLESQREETIWFLFNQTPLPRCKQPLLVDIVSKCLSARSSEVAVDDLWKDIGYTINCQLMEIGCAALWPIGDFKADTGQGTTIKSFFETPSIGLR